MNHLNNINHLVVIRISDSSAMNQLTKKVRETCDLHPDLPGADMLRRLGSSPLREPETVGGRPASGPGFRAVHFRIPGTRTWVLMALGSATMPNLGEDDNRFVQLLADTLEERSVDTLWVADFSRLVRSIDYFSHTWRAVRDHCLRVRHAGAVIETSSGSAEIQFLF